MQKEEAVRVELAESMAEGVGVPVPVTIQLKTSLEMSLGITKLTTFNILGARIT